MKMIYLWKLFIFPDFAVLESSIYFWIAQITLILWHSQYPELIY